MSAVVLRRLWLNAADDSSDARGFRLGVFTVDDGKRAEVRIGASGRARAFTTAGRVKSLKATLRSPDAEERAWLQAHAGELVWIRDPDGGKFAGICPVFSRARQPGPVGVDVEVEFTEVTASEEV